jgi:thioredoxin 1
MKSSNVLLIVIGVILVAIGVMLSDVMSPSPVRGASQNPQLRSAIASGQPVLLEFYADWCPPCRSVGPVVEELAKEVEGKARVVRLNVDEHGDLAREYGVRGIPAFIALKQGKETAREVGAIEKTKMRQMLGM